jgi:glycosyltransferase involved in cell wall biosynthesis
LRNIAFCSPIHLPRDGVAIPARELVHYLSHRCNLVHFPLDHEIHGRDHYRRMAKEIDSFDLLHIEHTHSFFKLPLFPFREAYLDFLRKVTIPRLAVYHEPVTRVPVYFPFGDDTAAGLAIRAIKYCAMTAAEPFANALWLPWYNRRIFSLPERVVVHTEYRAAMVRRFAPAARISVIPAPVYGPLPKDEERDAEFPLPFHAGDVVSTIFGFIDRRKDYLGALQALLRLPPEYKLIVAGGCFNDSEYKMPSSPYCRMMEFARAHHLTERVHVTGFCPDWAIPKIMAASDFVIAPFLQDHSSGSINMGLAYSRPVIAYRTLLTEEMRRNGAGLILIDGKEHLGQAILDARADRPGLLRTVCEGSSYCRNYGFPAQAERFAQWYEEVLASSK